MKLQILSENVLREKYAKGEEKQLPGHVTNLEYFVKQLLANYKINNYVNSSSIFHFN